MRRSGSYPFVITKHRLAFQYGVIDFSVAAHQCPRALQATKAIEAPLKRWLSSPAGYFQNYLSNL